MTENILNDLLGEVVQDNNKASPNRETWKEKCSKDLELFCKHYFPDIFSSEFCEFHRDVFKTIEQYLFNDDYKNQKNYMARAAPRGHGKSQIISTGLPLFCICYGYRRNILIVSDTNDQAVQFIAEIKIQIEDNELLVADFGNLIGKTWKSDRFVTSNGVFCSGKGAAQKLRGSRYNNVRPDLVVIDDLENDESVETEGQRTKLSRWFLKALLKVGYIDTIFIYIGTILSYNSLLNKVLKDKQFAMWNRRIYKAVMKFSSSELWEQWEEILDSSDNMFDEEEQQKIALDAYKFYIENKKEMLEDVECLWPEKEPDYYYGLMLEKYMDEESFNSEEQNDPMTDSLRDFKEEWIESNYYDVAPEIVDVYGAVDPTIVSTKYSDTSAIIILGRGIDNKIYVLEADIKKRKAEQIIEDMFEPIIKYYDKLRGFVVETNCMQQFFANTLQQKFLDNGLYINWIEIKHPQGDAKDRRIKSMIPKIKNGYVKFNPGHKRLINQLKNYPKNSDDGPDALQMCLEPMVGLNARNSFSFGGIKTKISVQHLKKQQEYDPTVFFK